MNIPVKRTKPTALGKKCKSNRGTINAERDFIHRKGAIGYQKELHLRGPYVYDHHVTLEHRI